LYLLIHLNTSFIGIYTLDFSAPHFDDGQDVTDEICMDFARRLPSGSGWTGGNGTYTEWDGSLPSGFMASVPTHKALACLDRNTGAVYDAAHASTWPDRLIVYGDVRGASQSSLVVGAPYSSVYTFSEQFLRTDDGTGKISTHQGRLQYRRWSLIHGPSHAFTVTVRHLVSGVEYIYNYIKNRLTELGGVFKFPVRSASDRVRIEVTNDTIYSNAIVGAEWEAFYTGRAQKV
jgi:hypothetical protein